MTIACSTEGCNGTLENLQGHVGAWFRLELYHGQVGIGAFIEDDEGDITEVHCELCGENQSLADIEPDEDEEEPT